MNLSMLLEGLHIPLTTPFHPDGRLHLPKLAANVARYSNTPAAGLIVLGPNAEPTLLSDHEAREVLRTAAAAAAPEKVLLAGVSRDSVREGLALAEFAAEHRYDAVLIGVPSFLSPESWDSRLDSAMRPIPMAEQHSLETRTFFQTVADRSPLPVILLTEPGRTITPAMTRSLASHANIIGLMVDRFSNKIQSGLIRALLEDTAGKRRDVIVTSTFAAVTARMQTPAPSGVSLISASALTGKSFTAVAEQPVQPAYRTRTKSVGFQIVCANSSNMLDALNTGATAIAPAFAACAPQACYEVYAAWKDADQPLAEEKQLRLHAAAALAEESPGLLKFACDLNGYFGGHPRLPHLPPAGDRRAALQQQMAGLRN